MNTGEKPVLAILGGAKVSSKITIIENMLDKIDHLIIGGGMVYTLPKHKEAVWVGRFARMTIASMLQLLEKAKSKGVEVHLPTDVIIAEDFSNDANQKVCKVAEIPDEWEGLDAGPETLKTLRDCDAVQNHSLERTLGVFEFENFSNGTITLGEHIANSTGQVLFLW